MDQPTDLELLQGCIAGERRAWDRFVERFTRYVYYLIQLTGRRYGAAFGDDAVADLHNDVFLSLIEDDRRRLRAFEGRNGCSVRSWIRVITIRKTLDALRRRRPHLSLDATVEEGGAAPQLADEGPDPLEVLVAREDAARRAQFDALVEQLKPADRLLLSLLYEQKLPVEEAAAALRISRGALYTRKTRIIKRLRAIAEDEGLAQPSG
ncbi:MAG: sigma-70 family RNA polymerase sigma factor [Myxococcales bacterium]|nr:sigma-70 family RNA polymerase sigma factor [Myxococcales bacterium]